MDGTSGAPDCAPPTFASLRRDIATGRAQCLRETPTYVAVQYPDGTELRADRGRKPVAIEATPRDLRPRGAVITRALDRVRRAAS